MTKVNVVTGGGSGIGKAIAAMLPKENKVIITGRTLGKLEKVVEELNVEGAQVEAYACDVSDRESVRKLAEYAASLGEVDKVIHAAGVSGSMADRETIIRINALGTVYVNQEFYKVMNGGCILDVASNSGYILPGFLIPKKKYPLILQSEEQFLAMMVKKSRLGKDEGTNCQIAYMLSKNFARWYSANCAFKYMKKKGIRVLSVSPGYVETPMTEKEKGKATDILLRYSGTGRGARPEEIAFLITSLADDRCSYLMGVDIIVDGGCLTAGYNFKVAGKENVAPSAEGKW